MTKKYSMKIWLYYMILLVCKILSVLYTINLVVLKYIMINIIILYINHIMMKIYHEDKL